MHPSVQLVAPSSIRSEALQLLLQTLRDAEHLAVARLQADALVTVDPELARRAEGGVVPLAPMEVLIGGR